MNIENPKLKILDPKQNLNSKIKFIIVMTKRRCQSLTLNVSGGGFSDPL